MSAPLNVSSKVYAGLDIVNLVHHTSKVRVLGSLGFRKLVFKIYYYIPRRLAMMVGMGLDSTLVLALQKEGSF